MSSALAIPPEPVPVVVAAKSRINNSLLLVCAGAVVLIAPLLFGAVEPWSVFALEASSALIFVAWGLHQFFNQKLEVTRNPIYWPMAAFLALIIFQWITGATAYRKVTYTQFLLYCAYAMVAFVVTQCLRRTSQFDWVVKAVTIYGFSLAAFAILQGIFPNGKLYWLFTSQAGGAIYGPYVNHNHYAGLMEMLTPFPLVLTATRFSRGGKKVLFMLIAAVMAGSIFLSGSRGGMLALAVQVIVLVMLMLRAQKGNWRQAAFLAAFLLVAIGLLVWIGGNEVTHRLATIHSETQTEIAGGTRLTIDRDCIRMFLARPFLGWGLGTFPTVYPGFRSFYTTFFINQAHNDYLQLLVETGLAGFAIAAWFLVVMFRRAAAKLPNWTDTATGTLTVIAILGCVGILVHSFLDFNLQIPANAALFYILCALAASPPLQDSRRRRVLRRHSTPLTPLPPHQ